MVEAYFGWNILLSVLLFGLGVLGVLWQRNALAVFMSIELMLNAANLALITFAQYAHNLGDPAGAMGDPSGGVLVLFIIAVAAAEAGVGLAIFVRFYQQRQTVELDKADELQG